MPVWRMAWSTDSHFPGGLCPERVTSSRMNECPFCLGVKPCSSPRTQSVGPCTFGIQFSKTVSPVFPAQIMLHNFGHLIWMFPDPCAHYTTHFAVRRSYRSTLSRSLLALQGVIGRACPSSHCQCTGSSSKENGYSEHPNMCTVLGKKEMFF